MDETDRAVYHCRLLGGLPDAAAPVMLLFALATVPGLLRPNPRGCAGVLSSRFGCWSILTRFGMNH